MSADASRRISALAPPWVRYGLIAGIVAFAATLAANLAITWPSPADLCRMGPFPVVLLSLGALVIFIAMAAAAGFKTARTGSAGPDPTLSGLLVGVLGGCALVVLLPFVPSVEHRFQELAAVCPGPALSGGGSFSFNFGPTPPPGVLIPTPPPEFFATPPPGAFVTPPPGAFVFPPPGPGGTLGLVLQMLITILIGTAAATGAATIAGQAGTAARSRALEKGAN
jgi:hypothetical protein